MANNRVYLRFKQTGHEVFLAKYYPSTGWYHPFPYILARQLAAAFDEEHSIGDLWGVDQLELAYEIAEEGAPQANATEHSLVYRNIK